MFSFFANSVVVKNFFRGYLKVNVENGPEDGIYIVAALNEAGLKLIFSSIMIFVP